MGVRRVHGHGGDEHDGDNQFHPKYQGQVVSVDAVKTLTMIFKQYHIWADKGGEFLVMVVLHECTGLLNGCVVTHV